MKHLALAALALPLLVGCTQTPGTPPSAGIPLLDLRVLAIPITSDPVVTSVQQASAMFADPPRRLAGRPALAAQTIAQFEYATVALNELRFFDLNPLTQIKMVQGRHALREVLGVRQDAPPEQVITRFTEAAGAFARGDTAAAEAALAALPLTRPPAEIVATVRNMPYVPAANWAASFAEQELRRDRENVETRRGGKGRHVTASLP
jgi:hypothetical protein